MTKKYFNSIIEMATAIYEDKDVRTASGTKLTFNPKEPNPWRLDNDSINGAWGLWSSCYEVVDWKESVSEENPRLCYVSDVSEKDAVDNKSSVRLINDFISDHKHAFKLNAMSWKYAVPVPKEEVLKWLVDNEE